LDTSPIDQKDEAMKSISSLPILASLLYVLAGPTLAMSADSAPIEDPLKSTPPEVVALAKRGLECRNWSTVEISGEATDTTVSRAFDDLHCDSLDAEVVALRRKYAQSPPTLRALNSARKLFP
jgi:hypothetical protein